MKLHDAQAQFLIYLAVRKNRSPNTINTYDKILNDFSRVIGNKEVSEITVEDIDCYADVIYRRGNSAKTRRNRLATVRSLIRYLYAKDVVDLRPEKIELPTVKYHQAVYLTTDEARRLIGVVKNIRDRALILTLLSTWARINECLNMRVEDINRGSVLIRAGKGGKPRPVFLNYEAREAIRVYLAAFPCESGYLFVNNSRTRLHERYVRRIIQDYAKKANIHKKVSCHTLRHTGATGFLEAGGRIEDAQQILGHSDISTTMVYLHFINSRLHNAHRAHIPAQMYTYPQKRTKPKQKRIAISGKVR